MKVYVLVFTSHYGDTSVDVYHRESDAIAAGEALVDQICADHEIDLQEMNGLAGRAKIEAFCHYCDRSDQIDIECDTVK